ncbi:MAG: hypothetical protein IJP92_10955 [Lachnospiraceae bacterium]|nr:hypothetical protein [Lachnospiraceae bacterium]
MAGIPYQYSMSIKHYSDPYGLLVNRVASCAGHTRTVGFMLNMLGIPYQHMNEGQYSHQWVRVQIDGVWYCVDGQVGMMMAEPSPGWHPAMTGQTLYTDGKGNFWVR